MHEDKPAAPLKPPVRTRTRPQPYAIGYGKPPVHSRFKRGQSGNPRGRPKAAHSLRTFVSDILLEKVPIRANGQDRKITRLEALLLKQVELAGKGNPRALEKLIHLFMTLVPDEAEKTKAPTTAELTETDQSILAELATVIAAMTAANPGKVGGGA